MEIPNLNHGAAPMMTSPLGSNPETQKLASVHCVSDAVVGQHQKLNEKQQSDNSKKPQLCRLCNLDFSSRKCHSSIYSFLRISCLVLLVFLLFLLPLISCESSHDIHGGKARLSASYDVLSKNRKTWSLVPPQSSMSQSQARIKRSLVESQSGIGQSGLRLRHDPRMSSPMRTSPFRFQKKENSKTVTDILVSHEIEMRKNGNPGSKQKPKKQISIPNKIPTRTSHDDNLTKYYRKKLRRQKREERLYYKIKKFVVRECKQDSENRIPGSRYLRTRSTKENPQEGASGRSSAVRRHIRKRHKIATAMQCDFKLKQIMHQLKRGKLVYMYSLAAYPDRYLRLFHADVRNCFLASTFSSASSANNEIQTDVQTFGIEHVQLMGPRATKLLQRCLERKIRHKATSLTELGRLLVDLRSIFIGLCSGTFRQCNQDFGILVEAPIRGLYDRYGRKTRLLGEQIRDILLGCGRSPDFYHCTYASLKEYSTVYRRKKRRR